MGLEREKSTPRGAGAPEIEITPEMIEAGVKELLRYDPDTGIFRWRVAKSANVHVGDIAGSDNGNGYLRIMIDERHYRCHRLAWLYCHGQWPAAHLDHINRDRADNRIANLREATRSQNMANRSSQQNSTHGFKGVIRNHKRWSARIKPPKNKYIHLGTFDTPQEAHDAYLVAAHKIYGEFARAE